MIWKEHLFKEVVIGWGFQCIIRSMENAAHWTSLLPALVAIGLAMIFRQVVLALWMGVWLGASLLAQNPATGFLRSLDHYVVGAMADSDHVSVIVFSLMLGGMVGIISKSGGALGLANGFTKLATNRRRGQLAGWFMGLVIFFDDYANTLLVGTSMRPITDDLKISREKLAFLVDATAAPVASLAIVSSWIGMEVGAIGQQLKAGSVNADAYGVFLQTIPYRFYPILMLVFGFTLVFSRRDFGPMLSAEIRAIKKGKVKGDNAKPVSDFDSEGLRPIEGKPQRWINALLPVFTVVFVVMLGMWLDGRAALLEKNPNGNWGVMEAFTSGDSFKALMWASFLGCMVAAVCSLSQRILGIRQVMDAWLQGVKSMVGAMVILVLAWAMGSVCKDVGTARWLVGAIGDWLPVGLLPAAVFLVAAVVSFSTGTSWGTMGILFPLVVPLALELGPGDMHLLLGAVSSVLAGSVWGDHCSPISDTTILSSMACSCDHVDHVRTQMPYALLVGGVSLVFGDLATGLELYPAWLGLFLASGVLVGLIFVLGKKVDDAA